MQFMIIGHAWNVNDHSIEAFVIALPTDFSSIPVGCESRPEFIFTMNF